MAKWRTTVPQARNLHLLRVFRGLRSAYLYVAYLTPYFTERGISVPEIFILQTVVGGVVSVAQVWTGRFADRVGRKWSMLTGSLCWVAAFSLYSIGGNFWWFILYQALITLGFAFLDGPEAALAWEAHHLLYSEDTEQAEHKGKTFLGRLTGIEGIWEGAVSLISMGVVFATTSLRWTMIIQLAVYVWLVPLVLLLHEEPRVQQPRRSIRSIVSDSWQDKPLRWWLATAAFFGAATYITIPLVQLYFKDAGIRDVWNGGLWAIQLALLWPFSLFVGKFGTFCRRHGLWSGLLGLLAVLGLAYGLLGVLPTAKVWVWLFWLFYLVRALHYPINLAGLQREVGREQGATVLALRGSLEMIMSAVLGGIIAVSAHYLSLQGMLLLAGGLVLLVGGALVGLMRAHPAAI